MNTFKPTDDPTLRTYAEQICADQGLKEPLTRKFVEVLLIAARVFDYKQGKYGPGNIAKFGEDGVMVRVSDKLERIVNLWRTKQEPADETKDDSWGDLLNYAGIALLCRWGQWPGVGVFGAALGDWYCANCGVMVTKGTKHTCLGVPF